MLEAARTAGAITAGRRAAEPGRLLEAAGEMYSESGLNLPMSEIARRAGVGIATVARI